jgi:ABC-type nitrate/sulfonate/bicarbonate transport system substrate-binding protein
LNRTHRSLAALLTAVVVGCGTGASPAPSAPTPVRLALDWTPNTNHTGFYVAHHEGWYTEAGVRMQVLPYSGTAPETLLAAHQADCGISFQDALTFAAAAGADITSVMAILQHTAQEIAVLADSGISRPSELDGTTYVGFGYPNEVPTVKAVIEADGGTGDFEVATLADAAAYQALYAGQADFAIVFTAWEGIEAGLEDVELRTFAFTDYGFPDFYQVVLACDRQFLEAQPAVARAFVAATVRGFELAESDPSAAAQVLIDENPGIFANPELPKASARFMADEGLLVDADGRVGVQTLEQWQGYSGFLYEAGLLVDADGAPLSDPPDYARLFTNDFLPQR